MNTITEAPILVPDTAEELDQALPCARNLRSGCTNEASWAVVWEPCCTTNALKFYCADCIAMFRQCSLRIGIDGLLCTCGTCLSTKKLALRVWPLP